MDISHDDVQKKKEQQIHGEPFFTSPAEFAPPHRSVRIAPRHARSSAMALLFEPHSGSNLMMPIDELERRFAGQLSDSEVEDSESDNGR